MTTITVNIDDSTKEKFSKTCEELGLDMSTAINIFAKRVIREHGIPFDVTYDPYYSGSNMQFLLEGANDLNNGFGAEHDIIEVK